MLEYILFGIIEKSGQLVLNENIEKSKENNSYQYIIDPITIIKTVNSNHLFNDCLFNINNNINFPIDKNGNNFKIIFIIFLINLNYYSN